MIMTEKTLDSDSAGLTDVQRDLFEAACAVRRCEFAEIIDRPWEPLPDFNWRVYVDEACYQSWEDLPLEAKLIDYMRAAEKAADHRRYDPPEYFSLPFIRSGFGLHLVWLE